MAYSFEVGNMYETQGKLRLLVTEMDETQITFKYVGETARLRQACGLADQETVPRETAQKTAARQGWSVIGSVGVTWVS